MLPKYKMSHFVFVVIALLQAAAAVLNIAAEPKILTSAGIMSAIPNIIYILVSFIYFFTLISQICLSDFSDKTSYYEILGGHTRFEVYFGRVIPSLILGTLGTFVLMIIPDITATILLGWGNEIPAGEIIIRRLLLIFPIFRLGCEFVCIAFIVKKLAAAIIMGIIIVLVGGETAATNSSPWLGVTSVVKLYEVDVWATYGLDANINFSYETSLQAETVVPVIIFSVVAAVISLVMGYQFFRADDMN